MLRCDKQNTLGICKFNEFQVTVAQNAHGHKQRTLEPPVRSWRTLTAYAPLRAEGSESVPAVVSAFCGNVTRRDVTCGNVTRRDVTCSNVTRRDSTRKEVFTWTAKQ